MRRRIIAFGSAVLLALTVTTAPLSAADLGMPTKAPIMPAAVEEFCWPCVLALLAAVGVGVCLAECGCLKSCPVCVSPPCS
jgi:hypothetical protein